jgi:hypothetical protein
MKKVLLLVVGFLQFTLVGCAMAQKMAYQTIEFNTSTESTDVDILDWQYGEHGYVDENHQRLPRASKSSVEKGEPQGGGGHTGVMPVGDFLYVKWRVKNTGELHEVRASLVNKLPLNMHNYTIHWLVKDSQLRHLQN